METSSVCEKDKKERNVEIFLFRIFLTHTTSLPQLTNPLFFKCMHDVIQVDQKVLHAVKIDTQVYYSELKKSFATMTCTFGP